MVEVRAAAESRALQGPCNNTGTHDDALLLGPPVEAISLSELAGNTHVFVAKNQGSLIEGNFTLRVQVPNNHITTHNLY